MKHGKEATSDAIFHGAFNTHPALGNIMLEFIHPRDEVRTFTPEWIIQAFINLVI
jgi:hypothetical protein